MLKKDLALAILKTVIYADIFDYPLTLSEIQKWLIKFKIISQRPISLWLKKIKKVKKSGRYYYLLKRNNIIAIREQREKYSKEKLKIAKRIASLLKIIPFIKLVGITGALAMNNTKKDDDIDLFIITSNKFLWTTRFLSTIIVELTGFRRHPNDIFANDKICLNMYIDEEHLEIPKTEQDIFSAHEVRQMRPLLDRNYTYQKFLLANEWVRKYLPNADQQLTKNYKTKNTSGVAGRIPPRWRNQKSVLETFFKKFQLWYMRNRRTNEVIKEGIIRLHPQDAREWVMNKYRVNFKKYGTI